MIFEEENPKTMIPTKLIRVIPDKIDNPFVRRTRLTTSESRLEFAAPCAKAIMKWDENSAEKATLIIRFTSELAFNSMDNTNIPAIMCNRNETIVTMNTK